MPSDNELSDPSFDPRSTYGDDDEFRRDTADTDPLEILDQSGDWFYIKNHLSGRIFELTNSQVIRLGMGHWHIGERKCLAGGITPDADPMMPRVKPKPKVHVFHQGSVMCNTVRGRPVDWPTGHEWVSLSAYEQGAAITCAECYKVAARAKGNP